MIKIGRHAINHGDVMHVNFNELIETRDGKVDIMYSDPPWGQGNLRYWQTMNKKQTGATKEDHDINEFLKRIFWIAKTYCRNLVFLEYSVKFIDEFIAMGEAYEMQHHHTIDIYYKSGSRLLPNVLHIFTTKFYENKIELPAGYREELATLQGYPLLRSAIKPFASPGQYILDPCCGMGYTAQFAIDHDLNFVGNELNKVRLQKTINRFK